METRCHLEIRVFCSSLKRWLFEEFWRFRTLFDIENLIRHYETDIGFHLVQNFFRTSQVEQKYRFREGFFVGFWAKNRDRKFFYKIFIFFACIFDVCRVVSMLIECRR
jgi:hypothetical protein